MNNLICSYMKYILRVWLLKDDLIPFDEILSELPHTSLVYYKISCM